MQIQANRIYRYRAFGLNIESDIECPELVSVQDENVADVQIRFGSVPDSLEEPKKIGVRFQAKPNHFLLRVDHIAKFLVSNGNQIIIHKFSGVRDKDIRLFLLGSAVGASLHQRGMLPIHASAIKIKDKCVVFCGASGNGKSTIAMECIERGYDLHADDICVISVSKEEMPMVYPGYPQIKLWEDVLIKIGGNPTSYNRVRQVLDKFAVPVTSQFSKDPLLIKKIYILSPWNKYDIEISEVTGMNKFNALKNNTYRLKFIEGLGNEVSHFKAVGIVGNQVPISRVHRPRKPFLLNKLADLIEKDFLK